MIEIKALSFSYQEKEIFADLDLTIKKGEFVAILGHNGSGKSTLAKLLVGLEAADEGEIKVSGVVLSPETILEIRKEVSIVFQNPDNQFVGATVADDVAFGLENQQMEREKMVQVVAEHVEKMGLIGLEEVAPHALSGGQKQRVAVAAALAMGGSVLILDEATSMLDPVGRKELMRLIRELAKKEGQTIVMITHHLDEAVYADRIVVLEAGSVIKDGTPNEVLVDKESLISIDLDVPFAVAASEALIEAGMLDEVCVTNEALVEALCISN